jgi:hypothetical protein
MRCSPIARTERRTSAKRCVQDCARDSSWPLEARSLGPGWFKGTAAAWPFRFRIEAIAFSISEQKFYSRLSFLNAAPEKPGQTPSRPRPPNTPQNAVALGQVSLSPGPSFIGLGSQKVGPPSGIDGSPLCSTSERYRHCTSGIDLTCRPRRRSLVAISRQGGGRGKSLARRPHFWRGRQ